MAANSPRPAGCSRRAASVPLITPKIAEMPLPPPVSRMFLKKPGRLSVVGRDVPCDSPGAAASGVLADGLLRRISPHAVHPAAKHRVA